MNKRNSKRDKLLQVTTFKNEDTINKERKKIRLENNNTIDFDLAHIYGSW